jgi:polyisoprenoid-binding protein YceI
LRKLVFIAGGAVVLIALAIVAVVAITLIRDDDPDLATEAPAIPTASSSTATPSASGGATPAATPAASSTALLKFVVDPAQSSATYVVREKLSRLPVESDASGTTQDGAGPDITGELYVTPQGLATSSKSTFRVDLTTIRSDESLRDRFVRDNTLQTNTGNNRYADFMIDSVTGFPANYVEGQEVQLTLSGQMTIHGVTKPVTFQVKARRAGEFLTATADSQFNMSDFGITPPNVPTAKAQDLVRLQVILVSRLAAG